MLLVLHALILCFIVVLLALNIIQHFFGYDYGEHPLPFLAILLTGIVVAYHLVNAGPYLFTSFGIFIAVCGIGVFVTSEDIRGRYLPWSMYFGYESLPVGFRPLLQPTRVTATVKIVDVFFQDLVLLGVATYLLSVHSVSVAGLVCALVVFALHLPGGYFYGRVYGLLFLVSASIAAFFVPLILSTVPYGFYLIFVFHLLMYPSIMVGAIPLRIFYR